MKKILRWVVIVLAVGFAALQLFRPPKNAAAESTGDDFITHYQPPVELGNLLRVSCYDCHSNSTRYPWYAEIQPMGWWLADHITDAKAELNFSEFGSYRIRRKFRKLEEMVTEVEKDEMPLPSYRIIHTDAEFSPAQRELFLNWVGSLRDSIKANTHPDSLARPKPAS